MIRTKTIKDKLKSYNTELHDAFIRVADESFTRACESSTPNTPIPLRGKLLDELARDKIANIISEQKESVRDIIGKALDALERNKAAAPSQDAVNYLSMLAIRSNVTQEEIDSAYKMYGDNYDAYKAICDIARKNDLLCGDSYYLNGLEEDLKAQLKEFERRAEYNAERFGGEGYVAFINSTIDMIPEVEIEE